MTLRYVALGLIVVGSLWTPTSSELDASQLTRLETGVTSYDETRSWWGPGTLVGRSGQYCGAIRSQYDLTGERQLELSWDRGVVCDWKVSRPDVASALPPPASSG